MGSIRKVGSKLPWGMQGRIPYHWLLMPEMALFLLYVKKLVMKHIDKSPLYSNTMLNNGFATRKIKVFSNMEPLR